MTDEREWVDTRLQDVKALPGHVETFETVEKVEPEQTSFNLKNIVCSTIPNFSVDASLEMGLIKNKVMGAIYGKAIGDAFGSQTEFHANIGQEDVRELGNTWGYPFPAFSDDTQMTLAIAEALIDSPPRKNDIGSIDEFINTASFNFVAWLGGRYGRNDRSPGGTCMGGVRRFSRIKDWHKSGSIDMGKGNGGVMRAGVVGAALWKDPIFAFQIGALTSVPTHNNIESLMASGGVAFLVASSINSTPFSKSVANLLELLGSYEDVMLESTHCRDEDPDWAIARLGAAFAFGKSNITPLEFKRYNLGTSPNRVKGSDFKAIEALAAAIFYNAKHNLFREVIYGTANFTGDSDTTSAIAGEIFGSRMGVNLIPGDWRKRVERSDYIAEIGEKLFNVSLTYNP